mgnify:CR=1 FL=1
MTALIVKNTAFGLALIVLIGGLSQCSQSAYAAHAHPHGELILAGQLASGAQPPERFFLCVLSAYARFMAWQEGDTLACAGFHLHRSANPLLSCHPHLAVNGKTSFANGVSHD